MEQLSLKKIAESENQAIEVMELEKRGIIYLSKLRWHCSCKKASTLRIYALL